MFSTYYSYYFINLLIYYILYILYNNTNTTLYRYNGEIRVNIWAIGYLIGMFSYKFSNNLQIKIIK